MALLLSDGKIQKLLKSGSLKWYSKRSRPTFRQIMRAAFLLFLLGVLIVLVINTYVFSYGSKYILVENFRSPFLAGLENVTNSEVPVAVILGASVYSDGSLSPVLKERVLAAIDLYKTGQVKKLIVSGDNGTMTYNEVIPIRTFLLENEIPSEAVFTDFAGFNTYDSMYRAYQIFGARNVLIVTQRYHLPRALFVARKLGLNAYGVSADGRGHDDLTYFKDDTREIFATVKTFFKVVARVTPHHLGPQISIEGDGRESLR